MYQQHKTGLTTGTYDFTIVTATSDWIYLADLGIKTQPIQAQPLISRISATSLISHPSPLQKKARPWMHVYYVEHSFARPDPSATLGEIATRFSILDYGILRFELAGFSVSTLFPSKKFPFNFKFSARYQGYYIHTTNRVCIQNGVESRVAAQQRCKKQYYGRYDQAFLSYQNLLSR